MSTNSSDPFGWGPHSVIPQKRLEFLASLAAGRKILDIGCGPGHLINHLSPFFSQVIGIDKHQYQNKKIIKGQAADLPFPKNSFDTAYLNNVLEHNPDDTAIVAEALRIAPRVIITVPQTTPDNLRSRGVVYLHYQDRSHLRTYTIKSLRQLIKNSGGQLLKIIPTEPLPNRELFTELIKGPILWRKLIAKILFWIFRPHPYYLELVAVVKRKN